MVIDHLKGVLNFLMYQLTNAVVEGLNSKVATIQKVAHGCRNKALILAAVLFRCGDLLFYPSTPTIPDEPKTHQVAVKCLLNMVGTYIGVWPLLETG